MIPLAGRARRCSGGVVVRQALHHLVLAEFRTQLQHGIRKASHDVGERSFRELVEDANADLRRIGKGVPDSELVGATVRPNSFSLPASVPVS